MRPAINPGRASDNKTAYGHTHKAREGPTYDERSHLQAFPIWTPGRPKPRTQTRSRAIC